MRKGKMCAQAAHASLKVILDQMVESYEDDYFKVFGIGVMKGSPLEDWIQNLFTKIVVGCDSEEELMNLYNTALRKKIPCSLIIDAGKTEFKGVPTPTSIAIGPDSPEKIDEITGHLKLL